MLNTERLVILDVLSHPQPRSRAALYRELRQVDHAQVDAAIASLERAGILRTDDDTVQASDALRRLEAIGMLEAV